MRNFELQDTRGGTAVLVEDRQASFVILRPELGGLAQRPISALFANAGEPVSDLDGSVFQCIRAAAGADGLLRAGLLVPLGWREFDPAGLLTPDVVNIDDWEEDDDMIDDDEEEDEEEEDDDFLPDDTDDFDDDDEDLDEDEADE